MSGTSGIFAASTGPKPSAGTPYDFSEMNEGKPNPTLQKDAFLKLFITQLEHQDPLNPMDADQMVAQLATFTQLEETYKTNDHLKGIKDYQSSINAAQNLELLGRYVETAGNLITLEGGNATKASYVLTEDAEVTVRIYDHNGKVVREMEPVNMVEGMHELIWDGKDDKGNVMPDGPYKFKIIAYTDDSDFPIEVATKCEGPVTGLTFDADGNPMLSVGPYGSDIKDENGQPIDTRLHVYLSDILEVLDYSRNISSPVTGSVSEISNKSLEQSVLSGMVNGFNGAFSVN